MELRTSGPRSNFLWCLGGPFDECGCCCGLSLKQGIFIIGIIDIVFALLALLLLVATYRPSSDDAEAYVDGMNMVYNVLRGAFAVLGMNGVIHLKINWLYYYSYTVMAFIPLRIITTTIILLTYGEYLDGEQRFGVALNAFIGIAINTYMAKIIWSAAKRLENNEAILVMHGRAAAQLMQQQSNSLAVQPGFYAAPGQPVPQYELK